MKLRGTIDQIKPGKRIVYNDGRPGHINVLATVLAVDTRGITVQFDDRADTRHPRTRRMCGSMFRAERANKLPHNVNNGSGEPERARIG